MTGIAFSYLHNQFPHLLQVSLDFTSSMNPNLDHPTLIRHSWFLFPWSTFLFFHSHSHHPMFYLIYLYLLLIFCLSMLECKPHDLFYVFIGVFRVPGTASGTSLNKRWIKRSLNEQINRWDWCYSYQVTTNLIRSYEWNNKLTTATLELCNHCPILLRLLDYLMLLIPSSHCGDPWPSPTRILRTNYNLGLKWHKSSVSILSDMESVYIKT